MNRSQKIWIAAATIAVTLICAFAAAFMWLRPGAGPDDVIDDYLHAVQDKNSVKIADLTCTEVAAGGQPPLYMITTRTEDPRLWEWSILGSQEGDHNAEVQTRMKVDVFNKGEEFEYTITFRLVDEDGEWRVCGGSVDH